MSLEPSKFNVLAPLRHAPGAFIVNSLSGHADLLTAAEYEDLKTGRYGDPAELAAKGYLAEPAEEQARYRAAYLKFLDDRESDEVQLFYAGTYACNFGCDYCYQSGYDEKPAPPPGPTIAAFFAYVDQAFAGRKKYLTLFGGEPLLPAKGVREGLAALVTGAAARGIDIAVVSNGYHLAGALDVLGRAKIRELQVTLDGPKETHDRRRPLKGGGSTFDAVVAGIDAALARDLAVNLRVVVDRENLARMPELATFAIARGWTKHRKFKTQLGRNYELHVCQTAPGKLYSRLELYEELTALLRAHPHVLEFHKPAYHVSKFLTERGELPAPLFDACPACKTEWAFDHTGRIYSCTATVGKPGEELGTFYPTVSLDQAQVERWQERDVLAIAKCAGCSVQLICGGGCASVAKNRTGHISSPDCRPVTELLQLGLGLYTQP
jgi:uncharacterized protein